MGSVKGIGLRLLGLCCLLFLSVPRGEARQTAWGLSRFSRSQNGTVPFRNGEHIARPIPSGTADSVMIRRPEGHPFALSGERLASAEGEWPAKKPAQQSMPSRKHTQIWGKDGELWDPDDDTLLDFSYAGYHEGRNDFPKWEVGVNVRHFGAQGDGETDDTEAFKKAVEACPEKKVVFIPSGTYRLMDWIRVEKRIDFALRGESRDGTVLLLGVGLEEIHPQQATTGHDRPTTAWSWGGGFLWFEHCFEVGVEKLTIKGEGQQYDGHWKEPGYNGICFRSAEDAWVREVTFVNVDSGIFTNRSRYITVEDVLFESTPERPSTRQSENNYGVSGHHGICFGHSSSWCVADNVVFNNRFHHELGVSGASHHCVFSNARGPNLHFDFHTQEDDIHHILFTEIDAGEGKLIWRNNFYGACTGTVLWNIKGKELSLPQPRPGIEHPVRVEDLKTLLAGWPIDLPEVQEKGRPWFEQIAPEEIEPQNVYHAQRRRRLAETPQPEIPKADVAAAPSESTERNRRQLRFPLWTLLLALICAVPCSWLVVKLYGVRCGRRRTSSSPGGNVTAL